MSEGDIRVENIMLLVNTYKGNPTALNYNAVYEAIWRLFLRIDQLLEK